MKTLLLSLLLLATAAFTLDDDKHKIKKDDNTVFVDDKAYFKYEWNKRVQGLSVENISGTKLFFLRQESYTDASRISKSNTTGKVIYFSLIREGSSDVACEFNGVTVKWLAKILLEYDILDGNGNIKEENFQRMISQTGKTYSQNRPVNINIR